MIEIDRETLLTYLLFLAFIGMVGIAYLAQGDAGFYCEKLCAAEGHEFRSYSLGQCACLQKFGNVNFSDLGTNMQLPIMK